MKRGEVWWVSFDPSVEGEIRKKRPAVIVSNNAANEFLNRIQVVPLTSSVGKLYPSETYVSLGGKRAKTMADQLTTVSKKRLIDQAGTLSKDEIGAIERTILIQLDL